MFSTLTSHPNNGNLLYLLDFLGKWVPVGLWNFFASKVNEKCWLRVSPPLTAPWLALSVCVRVCVCGCVSEHTCAHTRTLWRRNGCCRSQRTCHPLEGCSGRDAVSRVTLETPVAKASGSSHPSISCLALSLVRRSPSTEKSGVIFESVTGHLRRTPLLWPTVCPLGP